MARARLPRLWLRSELLTCSGQLVSGSLGLRSAVLCWIRLLHREQNLRPIKGSPGTTLPTSQRKSNPSPSSARSTTQSFTFQRYRLHFDDLKLPSPQLQVQTSNRLHTLLLNSVSYSTQPPTCLQIFAPSTRLVPSRPRVFIVVILPSSTEADPIIENNTVDT
ncbi:hypothetical protein FJTKL_03175 [Diaporthe vaccinii]|uniref:Uncharacterized protein n=1 Tax=Diaporthe vaccinii TaxID=105482 RepID=A0ABR4DVW3_9PEZI